MESEIHIANRVAEYFNIPVGSMQLSHKYEKDDKILVKTNLSNSCFGLATILMDLVENCKNFRWSNKEEKYLVYQWLEFISLHSCSSKFYSHFDSSDGKSVLQELNKYLENHSYFAGYHKTLADVALYHAIYDLIVSLSHSEKEAYVNLCRWFNHIQHDDKIRQDKNLITFIINCNTAKNV